MTFAKNIISSVVMALFLGLALWVLALAYMQLAGECHGCGCGGTRSAVCAAHCGCER